MDIGEKKGKYSVKSGYRVLLANSNPFAYGLDSSCWKKTWSLHVMAKVRNLLCRACTNCLPTMTALRRKRVDVLACCLVCSSEPEDILHVLIKCQFVRRVWQVSFLGDISGFIDSFIGWWV